MKKIFQLILLATLSLQVFAQDAPDWQIDWSYNQKRPDWQAPTTSDYENFTVMLVKIEEALQPYVSKNDQMAIFVGNELRGLASPAYVVGGDNTNATSFLLKAFGNEANGEKIDVTLKYYNAQLHQIFSLSKTITYNVEDGFGLDEDLIPPFTLGSPKFPVVKNIDLTDILKSDGITPAGGDMVGAFVGNKCRGVTQFSTPNAQPATLTVYQRKEGESVTLKYYNAASKRVRTLGKGEEEEEEVVLIGDATGDGMVDVSDYIGIANYILGNIPNGFNKKAADVNGDGVIDVSDYIGVANLILYGNINGK
jgi:hypothetical protein